MADQFVAEIRIFCGNFAPVGWAFCNGQILPISQNTALFSLLGTTYGGNGVSTFALPNLQGRCAIGAGSGPGLTPRSLGEVGGSTTVTLTSAQMPSHAHNLLSADTPGTLSGPAEAVPARSAAGQSLYASGTPVPMSAASITPTGGGLPHNNLQPYLTLNFIIALQGFFPSRPQPPDTPSK